MSDALRAVRSSPLGESPPASPASWLAMGSRLRFDWLGAQQACFDLAQSDRQRLLVDMRLDQRTDVLKQTLAELAVISVDLPGPLGRVDHEAVFRVGCFEQIIDGRVGNALRHGHGSGHAELPPVVWISWEARAAQRHPCGASPIKVSSSRATSWTDVLIRVLSNSGSAASSAPATASRASITSGDSVARPIKRRTSSSHDGGARKTRSASGIAARIWRAP